jgi:hypothetical protein
MLPKMYPMCAHSFRKLCLDNIKFFQIYSNLGEPKPFDVTLRDGLQGLSKEKQYVFNTTIKKQLYYYILNNHNPKNIEIGSIVSEKVLPIFKDTLELYQYAYEFHTHHSNNIHNIGVSNKDINKDIGKYILIPNANKLQQVINNPLLHDFSFITSISNSFQLKNTKMTLEQSDQDIYTMLYQFDENILTQYPPNVKLYVSCINECPIEGKIDNDIVVTRLVKLNNFKVNNICLSDTCGSLTVEDFEYIVDKCAYFGLPMNKFSLHLHVKQGRENEAEQIIHKALDRKIIDFDVSLLESGGCSVTMEKEKLAPNLSYELYYKSIVNYIETKINEQK